MVRLYCELPGFFNDISDEVRLFTGSEDIEMADDEASADVAALFSEENGLWRFSARARIGEKRGEYAFVREATVGNALAVKRYKKRGIKIAAFRAMREACSFSPPWGSLTGIRPTRLLRELVDAEGEAEAARLMLEDFDVTAEKLALAQEIAAAQSPILASQTKADADVYIHIPFCPTRCLYCSFPSGIRTAKTDMGGYLDALAKDIRFGARILAEAGRRVRCMYMGGGTPTVLTADELNGLLGALFEAYGGFSGEFTVEAGRPDSITRDKLRVLRRFGVTRLSVNPQSMNEKTLALVGRSHSAEDVIRAMELVRDEDFGLVNMDLIAGLPGEDEGDMERTLRMIEPIRPENLTVHTLALKRSSRLVTDGMRFPLPGGGTVEAMVDAGARAARGMGMRPYYMYRQKYMSGNLENVGYALPGAECAYNVDMMEDTTCIMAHGAGSMTKCVYDAQRRVERVPSPKETAVYIAKVDALAGAKARLFEAL